MLENDNILKDVGKIRYDVPEGYFDSLRERLEFIPSMSGRPAFSTLRRMKPYLALAACLIVAVLTGNAILRSTAGDTVRYDYYDEMAYADLIPVTQPDEVFMTAAPEWESITEDDVISYLISSGASPEMIEYSRLIAKK